MKKTINKILKIISDHPMITAIMILALIVLLSMVSFGEDGVLRGRSGGDAGEMLTTTTSNLSNAWTNHPVYSGSAILNKLVIGKAESGGQVAIYDTITSNPTTESIVFFVTGSSAQVWELDLKIDTGILVHTTDQDYAMFFYTPD